VTAPIRERDEVAVSVIIPVRDDEEGVFRALLALSAQTIDRSRIEVIVADDGSQALDEQRLLAVLPTVVISRGIPQGSYAARNRGACASHGPVLAFCDADCQPDPDWLAEGIRGLEEADIVAGAVRFHAPARPTIWTLLDVDAFLDQEWRARHGSAATANLFVRREVYDNLGGFDSSLPSGGDSDFVSRATRAGNRLAYSPGAVVFHRSRDDWRSFFDKVWRINWSYAARETRAGRRPRALRLRQWVPVAPLLVYRRRFWGSGRLRVSRLRANGLAATPVREMGALAVLYLAVPYVTNVAQVAGWWRTRGGRTN
jgi:glycosyltransferase involved in cell wall biosynthesis